ncbi:hypothetical protein Z946_1325 [Sulfitobacter noctilucicola]|nr:hypothetical protein Z946_1325 [Sulfitobacter noctilucicola]
MRKGQAASGREPRHWDGLPLVGLVRIVHRLFSRAVSCGPMQYTSGNLIHGFFPLVDVRFRMITGGWYEWWTRREF